MRSHTKLIGIDDHPMEPVGVDCCPQVAEGKSLSSMESWMGGAWYTVDFAGRSGSIPYAFVGSSGDRI